MEEIYLKESETNKSKSIIQPFVFTTARYSYSVYEKRILYKIFELIQDNFEKTYDTNGKVSYKWNNEQGNIHFRIKIKELVNIGKGKKYSNYDRIKEAARGLRRKDFDIETVDRWENIGLIENPIIEKNTGYLEFTLHEKVYRALANFTKGYSRYILNIAFELSNPYSMRLYELASNNSAVVYSLDELRKILKIENKYKQTNDIKRSILDPVREDLNKNADFSYNYKLKKTGRTFTHIQFVFYSTKNDNNKNKEQFSQEILDLYGTFFTYLKVTYKFSTKELLNNQDLLIMAYKSIPNIMLFLSNLDKNKTNIKNKKGYIIGSIKKQLGI